MKKLVTTLSVLLLLLAACGDDPTVPAAGDSPTESSAVACDREAPETLEEGTLTVGTDRPAYPPWFEGSPKDYSGYEGEVAGEIADRLGLDIKWVVVPFNKSYAPGPKDFDFDINQISITPERAEVVDFSDGYFQNNQGILALSGNDITDADSLDDLKSYRLGAQVGTTSLAFISSRIQPDEDPKVYDTTNDIKSALNAAQVDALVTDVVTTVYLRDFEIEGSEVIGQFPTDEQFGMVFEKGNDLQHCVNEVLAEMRADGTLDDLQEEWLQDYLGVPELSG